jgi:thioredoxin-like negative regulator of GroEL
MMTGFSRCSYIAAYVLCLLPSFGPASRVIAETQSKEIPPATAKEIRELKAVLAAQPSDPAALFNLALDYAAIGEGNAALDLLEKMAQAHAGLDPKEPA